MDAKFAEGEYVDIAIRGARIVNSFRRKTLDGLEVMVLVFKTAADTDRDNSHTVPLYDGVTVERVAPVEWPPQPGDLWRDRDGDLWFAVDMNTADDPTGPCIEFAPCQGPGHEDPDAARTSWGPLTLVRREREPDWTWGDMDNPRSATDPSGQVWDLTAQYRDGEGQTWHWAGGFGRDGKDGPMRPLMSRDDYLRTDVQITDVPGPLAQVSKAGA